MDRGTLKKTTCLIFSPALPTLPGDFFLFKHYITFPVVNQVLFANQFLFTLVSVIKSSSMFDGMSRAIVVVPQEKMIVYPDHDESILEKNLSRFPP